MYQALRHFGRGVRLLEGHGALTKSATANLEGCTGVPRAGQLVFYNTSADKAKDEMKQQDKPDLGTTVQRGAAEQKAGAAEEAGYERARERGASVNETEGMESLNKMGKMVGDVASGVAQFTRKTVAMAGEVAGRATETVKGLSGMGDDTLHGDKPANSDAPKHHESSSAASTPSMSAGDDKKAKDTAYVNQFAGAPTLKQAEEDVGSADAVAGNANYSADKGKEKVKIGGSSDPLKGSRSIGTVAGARLRKAGVHSTVRSAAPGSRWFASGSGQDAEGTNQPYASPAAPAPSANQGGLDYSGGAAAGNENRSAFDGGEEVKQGANGGKQDDKEPLTYGGGKDRGGSSTLAGPSSDEDDKGGNANQELPPMPEAAGPSS